MLLIEVKGQGGKTKSASQIFCRIDQHAAGRSLFFIFSPFPECPKHARFAAVRVRINQQGRVEQFAEQTFRHHLVRRAAGQQLAVF
jgi:hypothetical protein